MLPIRQRLSALTCLKAGPKAVLIEVCELAENGGKGCMASNDYLAKKLGVSLATATRTVASLTGWGLLHSAVVKAEANRRYLTPSAAVRACYTGGSEAAQLAAAANLTIVKTVADEELTIVKPASDYSQNGELTIVKNVADYSQNASRVIGDDQYDHKTTIDDQAKELASLRSALVEAEKKIASRDVRIAELKGLLSDEAQISIRLQGELDTLKAANASAPRAKGAGRPVASLNPVDYTLPEWATATFVAEFGEWLAFRQKHRSGKLLATSIQKQLDELAGYDEAYCSQLFARAMKTGYQGLTFDDTPLKFAQYLQAKPENQNGNGTHHQYNGAFRNPQPSSRLNVEAAVGLSRDIAVGLDAARRAEPAAERHDAGAASYGTARPAALSYPGS